MMKGDRSRLSDKCSQRKKNVNLNLLSNWQETIINID